MKKLFTAVAAMVLGLLLVTVEAEAQCNAQWVMRTLQGSWKVNNAGGQGFGAIFAKPRVSIGVVAGRALSFNGSRGYNLGGNYYPEANPNGGTWCGFTVGGKQARLGRASNGWWIFEIGAYRDRNKVEMIRR